MVSEVVLLTESFMDTERIKVFGNIFGYEEVKLGN